MKDDDNYGFIDKTLKCPVVKNQLLHKVKSRSKQNKIRTAIKKTCLSGIQHELNRLYFIEAGNYRIEGSMDI